MPRSFEQAKIAKMKRKAEILQSAIEAAEKVHFLDLTRKHVTDVAQVSESLLNYYFHGMPCLREEIIIQGLKQGSIEITAQAMGVFHSEAKEVPRAQKIEALKLIGKKNGLRNI